MVGKPRANGRDTEVAVLGAERPGHLESSGASGVGQLLAETPSGRWRLALSGAYLNLNYRLGDRDRLFPGQVRFVPWIVSAQYSGEALTLTAEYAERYGYTSVLSPRAQAATGQSWYIQGGWRFTPSWEGLLRYDVYYADRHDRDGSHFAAATGLPSYTRFATDLTGGIRWDVTPSFMLRAEWHRVNGTGWLSSLDNPNPNATSRYWDMLMLLGSWRF